MDQPPKLIQGRLTSLLSETYLNQISLRSQLIYISILTFLVAILISLPLIDVPVNVNSVALIRPSTETSSIRSLVNGRIKESFVMENKLVQEGETLLTIESDAIREKEQYLQSRIADTKKIVGDLHALLKDNAHNPVLNASLYQQSWFNYKQRLADAATQYNKAKTEHDRHDKLHKQDVISDAEFENFQFAAERAKNEMELLTQSQLKQWHSELKSFEDELLDLEWQLKQINEDKENLIIKAPVSGTIQNMTGVYEGGTVFAGQDIATISPETLLIAEAYITPNDIGLIEKGMKIRFQVDAFNYNQWGLAYGTVMEVPQDIQLVNDRPVFRVKCSLQKDYLQLKSGYKGYFKKGMTMQARFMVTERSLWQLLFDKVDDWINPNITH